MDLKHLPCADCKYPGFNGLVLSCRHPQHAEPLHQRYLSVIQNGGKCPSFVDLNKKVMDENQITWPRPVSFAKEQNV